MCHWLEIDSTWASEHLIQYLEYLFRNLSHVLLILLVKVLLLLLLLLLRLLLWLLLLLRLRLLLLRHRNWLSNVLKHSTHRLSKLTYIGEYLVKLGKGVRSVRHIIELLLHMWHLLLILSIFLRHTGKLILYICTYVLAILTILTIIHTTHHLSRSHI